MKRLRLLLLALLLLLVAAGGAAWIAAQRWVDQALPMPAEGLQLSIAPGTGARAVARQWVEAGVAVPEWALFAWFRASGQDRRIRAGTYRIQPGDTPRLLLAKMVSGDEVLEQVRLPEGGTFRQWRVVLAHADGLVPSIARLSDAEIMSRLGRAGQAPEGRFYPDTYRFSRGTTDLTVLRRALDQMDAQLAEAWAARAPDLPLNNPDEALILASIVEKETGLDEDRNKVSAVFINRLRIGMPLQTDPTVIYGLGEAFDGNLRRRDLRTDTPFNTYTRRGLPPTPIAMPGRAALDAAVHPADIPALYFVARGDGTSQFSNNLADHNRAVRRYQLGER